jgi:hypothetical protein
VAVALVGTGTIGTGGVEYFDAVLTAGRAHRIYVHPTDPRVDFDLRVYDQNANLISEDISTSADAFCVVTPRWTGPFRFVVNSAGGMSSYTIVVED